VETHLKSPSESEESIKGFFGGQTFECQLDNIVFLGDEIVGTNREDIDQSTCGQIGRKVRKGGLGSSTGVRFVCSQQRWRSSGRCCCGIATQAWEPGGN